MDVFEMTMARPWFDNIKAFDQNVVGRVGYRGMCDHLIGKVVQFVTPEEDDYIDMLVFAIYHYETLEAYIEAEGWRHVAPHATSKETAVKLYTHIIGPNGIQVFSPYQVGLRLGINALCFRPA